MKVCLISAPIVTSFQADREGISPLRKLGLYPPLGILVLAGALERAGHTVKVVHPDLGYMATVEQGRQQDFVPHLIESLVSTRADVFGFSTICSSYPLTVRLARMVKDMVPSSRILLGGPQASVVDFETMNAFPWIDMILRGEADESLPNLLKSIASDGDVTSVSGLTYRKASEVFRAPNAPLLSELDRVASPAYHLYEAAVDIDRFPLELGRGCPFSCEFCSTNLFFSKRFRLRSPHIVFNEMIKVNQQYKVTDFELVHDMFTVDRKRVVGFCQYLLDQNSEFTWSCSARTDRVDEELLELMHNSGCSGVFFGVETGSQRLQSIIRKNLDVQHSRRMAQYVDKLGMNATASLITGFAEETEQDFRHTVDFFLSMLRLDSVEPQLHLLSPLPGTPIAIRSETDLIVGKELSDIAFNGNLPDDDDAKLIKAYPHIFSAYLQVPTQLNRKDISDFRDFLMKSRWHLRYVLVLLHANGVDLFQFFLSWRDQCGVDYCAWSQVQRNTSLLAAVRHHIGELPTDVQHWLSALIDLIEAINCRLGPENRTAKLSNSHSEFVVPEICDAHVPLMRRDIFMHEFHGDFRSLMKALRFGHELPRYTGNMPSEVLLVRLLDGWTVTIESISMQSQALLKRCAGNKSVDEIVRSGINQAEFCHIVREKRPGYIKFGIHMLAQQKIIDLNPSNRGNKNNLLN